MKNFTRFRRLGMTLAVLAAFAIALASCAQDEEVTNILAPTTHAVVFNIGGGAEISVQTVESGKVATEPAVAEKDGYVFSGWYTDATLTTRFSFETPITENLTLYARYAVKVVVDGDSEIDPATVPTEEGETVYIVKHYKQELDGNTYTLATAEGKAGKIGSLTAAEMQEFEGFAPRFFAQKTIAEDGSTVVSIEYDRREYTVTCATYGDYGTKQTVRYGDTAVRPTDSKFETRAGYDFGGWSADGETAYDFSAPVTASITLTVLWIPFDVRYMVCHHFQNIVDDEYTYTRFFFEDSILQYLTGKSGSQTEAAAFTSETLNERYIPTTEQQRHCLLPEGFIVQTIEQKEIAGDDSTAVDVYYDRKTVTYTFAPDGGAWQDGTTETKSTSGKYGAPLTVERPTRSGYLFVGWGSSSSCFGTEDAALTAQWIAQDAVAYINEMAESGTVVVSGDVTAEQISALGYAIRNRYNAGIQITLNLANATMTELAEGAFHDCYGLSEIILPATLTTIGNSAFMMCDSLTAVTIPEGVTTIGYDAFVMCHNLTSVTIPQSVTLIGRGAFMEDYSLASVVFADGENWYKTEKASYMEWNDSDKIDVSGSAANAINLTGRGNGDDWGYVYLVKKTE